MSVSWQTWAVLSATFAALTAVLGKVGIQSIGSDFATLIRTVVILVMLGALVVATGDHQPLRSISLRTYAFLGLSGLATGASWLCYYRALKMAPAAQVAPLDKLSVVMVAILGVTFLGEHLTPKNWLGVGMITIGAVLVSTKAKA